MSELFTQAEVRAALKDAREEAGSQKALAIDIGVSEQFLSLVVRGKKRPSAKVLTHLGFKREVMYRAVSQQGGETP